MKSPTPIIRAVSAEFVARKLKSIVLTIALACAVVLIITIWLALNNAWWWLITVPVMVLVIIGIVTFMIVRNIIKKLRPALTKQQKLSVSDFVDKLERVTEHVQTPLFLIVYRVIRDIVHHRNVSFLESATKDGTTLHKDFLDLLRNF